MMPNICWFKIVLSSVRYTTKLTQNKFCSVPCSRRCRLPKFCKYCFSVFRGAQQSDLVSCGLTSGPSPIITHRSFCMSISRPTYPDVSGPAADVKAENQRVSLLVTTKAPVPSQGSCFPAQGEPAVRGRGGYRRRWGASRPVTGRVKTEATQQPTARPITAPHNRTETPTTLITFYYQYFTALCIAEHALISGYTYSAWHSLHWQFTPRIVDLKFTFV